MRSRMVSASRDALKPMVQEIVAEIKNVVSGLVTTVPEDIVTYDSVLRAADIAGVDAEEARWLRDLLVISCEDNMRKAALAREARVGRVDLFYSLGISSRQEKRSLFPR